LKYYSNPQCFKEKNYITKFSTSLIFKKLVKKILKNNLKNKKKLKNKEEEEEEKQVNFGGGGGAGKALGKAKWFAHTSSSIWKKKPKNDYIGKKIIKKNYIEKYCSNSQCFFFNDRVKFSTSSIFEKNKQK